MEYAEIEWVGKITPDKSGYRKGVLTIKLKEEVTGIHISFGIMNPQGWSFGVTDLAEDGSGMIKIIKEINCLYATQCS